MPNYFRRLTSILLILLSSCSQPVTETPAPENTTAPIATKEFTPDVPKNSREMILFSMEEDGYAHLFAYALGRLPFTRLTSDPWDDINPAASPNGKSIAFASNRNGFWDLYLMDLSSGDVHARPVLSQQSLSFEWRFLVVQA